MQSSGALIVDPADGDVAWEVGVWARDRKLHFVGNYISAFATATAKKWYGRTVYLDLFAGPGRCHDPKGFYDGSALRSLAAPFGRRVFVEVDPTSAAALSRRVAQRGASSNTFVIEGDCNNEVDRVLAALPSGWLVLAVADHTNWQLQFETIRRLVTGRKVDLLITFWTQSLKRVRHLAVPQAVAFYDGSQEWRAASTGELLGLYRQQLVKLGYLDRAPEVDPPVTNLRNAPMYRLALFSRSDFAFDLWDSITSVEKSGQRRLRLT